MNHEKKICDSCIKNYYLFNSVACVKYLFGTETEEDNREECKSVCLEKNKENNKCTKCSVGYFLLDSEWKKYDARTFSQECDTICFECEIVKYSNESSFECMKCLAGTYSNASCQKCTENIFSSEDTSICQSFEIL